MIHKNRFLTKEKKNPLWQQRASLCRQYIYISKSLLCCVYSDLCPWLWLLAGGKDSVSQSWLWIITTQGTKSSDKMLLHVRAVSQLLYGFLSHLCPSHCPLLCLHCVVTCVWSIRRALSSALYFLLCMAELNHIRSLQIIMHVFRPGDATALIFSISCRRLTFWRTMFWCGIGLLTLKTLVYLDPCRWKYHLA